MKKTDIGVVGVFYGICIFFLVMTLQLPKKAQIYPLCIIILMAFLTSIYVVQMIRKAKKEGITSGLEDFDTFLPKQFFPLLGLMIGYLVLMKFVGFYISSAIFMIASLIFLKVKKVAIVISTVAIILLVYCAFTLFLGVHLPQGLIFG